jgi:hypothetical protein
VCVKYAKYREIDARIPERKYKLSRITKIVSRNRLTLTHLRTSQANEQKIFRELQDLRHRGQAQSHEKLTNRTRKNRLCS